MEVAGTTMTGFWLSPAHGGHSRRRKRLCRAADRHGLPEQSINEPVADRHRIQPNLNVVACADSGTM